MKEFDITSSTMVLTSTYVTEQKMPIVYVTHEPDEDGGVLWQFHCGNGDYDMAKMQLVRLDTILGIDPTLRDVADLALGFVARRTSKGATWQTTRE